MGVAILLGDPHWCPDPVGAKIQVNITGLFWGPYSVSSGVYQLGTEVMSPAQLWQGLAPLAGDACPLHHVQAWQSPWPLLHLTTLPALQVTTP